MMQIAGHEITDREYRALAYILEDPKAWIEHAAKQRKPEQAIAHKIKKALAMVADVPDEEYTTRAEREAAAQAEMEPTAEQLALSRELTRARLEALLTAARRVGLKLAQADLEKQIAEVES